MIPDRRRRALDLRDAAALDALMPISDTELPGDETPVSSETVSLSELDLSPFAETEDTPIPLTVRSRLPALPPPLPQPEVVVATLKAAGKPLTRSQAELDWEAAFEHGLDLPESE